MVSPFVLAVQSPARHRPLSDDDLGAGNSSAPSQLITKITVAPLGLNVRCTRGLPEPATVTLTVVLSPAVSVPDIGATTTFFSRPGGSETDQFTLPPEAVSVIVPVPGDVTSSVAGLTLSVPAPGGSLVLVLGLATAEFALAGEGVAVTLAAGLAAPEPPLAVGSTLACAGALDPAVGPCVPG
jgi:hypothetical protein